tara:strand:+ start:406 stop:1062 length:657 start_codon:yes stop_codon:yes gene_type:complete
MHPRKPVIANYKIFVFVGFICTALITSLFVYRTTHHDNMTLVNDENSVVMPVGRDLKSVDLVTTDGDAFTERNLFTHWTLMFFGFTHCNNVCPVTLEMMNKAYPTLHAAMPTLQVVFVSLDPVRDTKVKLSQYTQSFNTNFVGVSGKIESIRKLQSQLGIYSAIDSNTQDSDNYQLQHTSSIMLINPQGKWVAMFKYGLTPKAFEHSVIQAVKAVTKA